MVIAVAFFPRGEEDAHGRFKWLARKTSENVRWRQKFLCRKTRRLQRFVRDAPRVWRKGSLFFKQKWTKKWKVQKLGSECTEEVQYIRPSLSEKTRESRSSKKLFRNAQEQTRLVQHKRSLFFSSQKETKSSRFKNWVQNVRAARSSAYTRFSV